MQAEISCTFKSGYPDTSKRKNLGIGIVGLNFGTTASYYRKVLFYKDSAAKQIAFILEGWDEADSVPLSPFDNLGAPPNLYFRCIDSDKNMFHIITIDSTGKTLWIRKDTGNTFYVWLDYFQGFSGVEYGNQPIRSGPYDSCKADMRDSLCSSAEVLKIQGDWIQIETNDYCNIVDEKPAPRTAKGWVKWRNDTAILIQGYYNE